MGAVNMTVSMAVPANDYAEVPAGSFEEKDPGAVDGSDLHAKCRKPGVAIPVRSIERPGA